MKLIYLLYAGGFICSVLLGGVVACCYHYSLYFLILLCFPISFGAFALYDLFIKIEDKDLKGVTVLTVILFAVMVGLLVIAAYFGVDEWNFWGMIYAVGVTSYLLGLVLIGLSLPKRWEAKREREGKF